MRERLIIKTIFAAVLGLMLGAILSGWAGMPWWYVFPIALAGGIAIGIA